MSPNENSWREEDIAALIDGSVGDPAEEARLRRILEQDPAAAALAEDLRELRRLSRAAFDAPMAEPVPAGILSALGLEPEATAPPPRRPAARSPRRRIAPPRIGGWAGMAAAAAAALTIGVGVAQIWRPVGDALIAALGDAPATGALHAALETLPSGAVSAEGVQPLWSFTDGAGRPCREFEVIGELPQELEFGVACRGAGGRWHVEMLAAAPAQAPGPDGYAPASGPAATALDGLIDALDASPPMTPEAEAAWISRGWRAAE